jgi:hypothetical protein
MFIFFPQLLLSQLAFMLPHAFLIRATLAPLLFLGGLAE